MSQLKNVESKAHGKFFQVSYGKICNVAMNKFRVNNLFAKGLKQCVDFKFYSAYFE